MNATMQYSHMILPKHWAYCGQIYFDNVKQKLVYLCIECLNARGELINANESELNCNCFYDLVMFCKHKMMHIAGVIDGGCETNSVTQMDEKCTESTIGKDNTHVENEVYNHKPAANELSQNAMELEEASNQNKQILFSPFDKRSVQQFFRNERMLKECRTTLKQDIIIKEINEQPATTSDDSVINLLSDGEDDTSAVPRNLQDSSQRILSSEFQRSMLSIPTPEPSPQPQAEQNIPKFYKCDICAQEFFYNWQLNYHKKVHKIDRQKKKHCVISKGRSKVKNKHKSSSSKSRRMKAGADNMELFQCDLCPKIYKQSKRLRSHMSKCHLQISQADEVAKLLSVLDG